MIEQPNLNNDVNSEKKGFPVSLRQLIAGLKRYFNGPPKPIHHQPDLQPQETAFNTVAKRKQRATDRAHNQY